MIYSLWTGKIPFLESGDEDNKPILAFYPASNNTSRSAVIVCPGGGYHHRADHEGEPVAKWLNSLGISAFVLHYRVAPYSHPVPLADVQRAIRFVRHHFEAQAAKCPPAENPRTPIFCLSIFHFSENFAAADLFMAYIR